MYKTIDLCAGIGGIRKGFELTHQFTNVLSAEIDKYACITYEHLYKENPFNDICSEEFKQKVEAINYDVLLAGFPCQSFSMAGKKEGFSDQKRGGLFFEVAEIIKRTKPKAFLLENVKGLLTNNKGQSFKYIINLLVNDLKYKIPGVVNNQGDLSYSNANFLRLATNFGIPQKRERVYIVGFREDIAQNIELKPLPSGNNKIIYPDLNSLLDFKNEAKYYLSQGSLDSLQKHKNLHASKGNGFGFEIVNSPDIKNPIANTILATGGSGKERNLVYDLQDELSGLMVKGKKTPLNNLGIRYMSPREWGKLQGFINYAFIDKNNIDQFSFPPGISETQQYKQFGNSVCIPVIESIANYIYQYLQLMDSNK